MENLCMNRISIDKVPMNDISKDGMLMDTYRNPE